MTDRPPFTVTPQANRPARTFDTLDLAHAHAKRLMDRDSVQSVITDATGALCGSYEVFGVAP